LRSYGRYPKRSAIEVLERFVKIFGARRFREHVETLNVKQIFENDLERFSPDSDYEDPILFLESL
jgi:hypothetical protein